MSAIGRDGSAYGAHSLRIGGATAMAFLGASEETLKARGRWRSDAYLRYLRERRAESDAWAAAIAGADTDDIEADYVAIDGYGFDESDED